MVTERAERPPVVSSSSGERRAEARARLGRSQKTRVGVPAYLQYVNRPIGGQLAVWAYGFGMTPNQVTAISAALSFSAIAAVALVDPSPVVGIVVAFALLAGYAFDSADGQLARVRGGGGPAGEWLDHVVDIAKTAALHAATLVALDRLDDLPSRGWLAVPLVFLVVNITFFFGMMLRDKIGGAEVGAATTQLPNGIRSVLLMAIEYGLLCMAYATLGWTDVFLAVYTALAVAMTLFAAQSLVKTFVRLGR